MKTETNCYVLKSGDGGFSTLAYSDKDFEVGERVSLFHHTRFDGDIWEHGFYVAHKRKQTLVDGMIPSLFDNKLLRIGTIDIVRE